ncbi:T9SS type A sorting domain-containing protein [Parasediminibacterium sp. JCM 36343]|uniref:T9SS type A sorting domain-containing protein n=1 Tax=Parasediminibacterium sp. JCM 36343 TaxID=3374279 RepID=UPI00397BE443
MQYTKFFIKCLTILLLLAIAITQGNAQQISFPGAEGAGRFATGGRGTVANPTTVFEVTNLTDNNAVGSLRYACSQSIAKYPYRTIVFRVSGTIHLNSKLGIPKNTTIAGQTAPGDGICMADYPVVLSGNNIIVRYMRFRMGDKNQLKTSPAGCGVPVAPFDSTSTCLPLNGSGGDDAFGGITSNVIIDHCTVGWGDDETLTVYRGDSLTLQWNFITEGMNYAYHFETGDADFEHHGYGGIWGSLHGTFHHNLFAHCQSRNPRFAGNSTYAIGDTENVDFRNNVIYNWGLYTIYGGEGGHYNVVNNYYRHGPSTGTGTRFRILNVDSNAANGYAHYYVSGNFMEGSAPYTNNNWSGTYMITGKAADTVIAKAYTPYTPTNIPSFTNTAADAYDTVLKYAGVTIPRRDTLDQRIVNDVQNRIGRLIDCQGGYQHATPYAQTVNAWPTLNSDPAPVDTDHDGMPDTWETANGLNPKDASDRGLFAANGYTNLENYINGITTSPTPIPTNIATATWPLLKDQTATVTGGITAANQTTGSYVAGVQYGSVFGRIGGWQRLATTSYLPVGYNADSYTEYKVTPAAGKIFKTKSIGFSALGGGANSVRLSVYYSLDSFATSFPAGKCSYNGNSYAATTTIPASILNSNTASLAGEQIATIPTSITVQPSQTLSVRIYAWNTVTGNRSLAHQNVTINGITSDAPLPLTLIDFSATAKDATALLQWKTTNEVNIKDFEIEKGSDGVNFASINNVTAKNGIDNQYAFTDKNLGEGVSYYRLKMIDKDGAYSYSAIVRVENNVDNSFSFYPNPVIDALIIKYPTATQNAVVNILNIQGKPMASFPITVGSVQASFNIGNLSKGVYLLAFSDDKQVQTIKFLKE